MAQAANQQTMMPRLTKLETAIQDTVNREPSPTPSAETMGVSASSHVLERSIEQTGVDAQETCFATIAKKRRFKTLLP